MDEAAASSKQGRDTEAFHWSLEVALSGGGLRASAYALGALLYIAHSGLNARVKNISSVSGGSITNAYVGCHCDYSQCNDIARFRSIAAGLARKIAFSGLLQRWESWAWAIGVGTAAVTTIVLALDHFGQSASLALFGSLGSLLLAICLIYFRSWPIVRWLATMVPADRTLDDLRNLNVDHVFCATELKFGRPFFFSTAGRGRMFSGIYGLANAPKAKVITAVRASAAFPPAIPPIAFRPGAYWSYFDGSKFTSSFVPYYVWLTDGGVYNNFGTEWHQSRTELMHHHFANKLRWDLEECPDAFAWRRKYYGQVQLVVDASGTGQPTPLRSLFVPVIGFFVYVFRAMNVMYGSTLAGRASDSEFTACARMRLYPRKWLAQHADSRIFKHQFAHHSQPYDPELDMDLDMHGALRVHVPLTRPFNFIRNFWLSSQAFDDTADKDQKRCADWIDGNEAAEQAMGEYWPWAGHRFPIKPKKEEVGTTFRRLGRDATVKLIIEGYVKTREVLFWSFGYGKLPIPDRQWFASLCE